VYRRILSPVYDHDKENWRILTNKEIYAIVKKPTITETIRLHTLCWFGHVQRMEENRIPKRVLHRVIHKSVKHIKNSQQRDYAIDHGYF
jgi:hypothetical protein